VLIVNYTFGTGTEKTLVKGRRLIACKCGSKEWDLIAYSGKIPDSDKSLFDRLFR
jgi:hypothetical protein